MKITSHGYMYEGRIALQLIPETDVEETLLKSLWLHGRLENNGGEYRIDVPRKIELNPK